MVKQLLASYHCFNEAKAIGLTFLLILLLGASSCAHAQATLAAATVELRAEA